MTYDINENNAGLGELQRKLRYLSFALDDESLRVNVTGRYDDATENGIRRFQETNKLPVTGVADSGTSAEISRRYKAESKLRAPVLIDPIGSDPGYSTTPGERSDTVMILQIILNALSTVYGYPISPVSGVYGKPTFDSVMLFQKRNLLPETGIADRNTWHHLGEEYNSRDIHY